MSKKAYAVSSDFSVEKVPCFHCLSNTQEKLKIKPQRACVERRVQSLIKTHDQKGIVLLSIFRLDYQQELVATYTWHCSTSSFENVWANYFT